MTINATGGFPRRNRLLTAADYREVFKQPKRVSSPELLLLFTQNQQANPRLGLAIAKKQIKNAVDRNRVKRIIRESFRCKFQDLPAVDIVVLARKSLLNMDNTEFRKKLDGLLEQVRRKCKLK